MAHDIVAEVADRPADEARQPFQPHRAETLHLGSDDVQRVFAGG